MGYYVNKDGTVEAGERDKGKGMKWDSGNRVGYSDVPFRPFKKPVKEKKGRVLSDREKLEEAVSWFSNSDYFLCPVCRKRLGKDSSSKKHLAECLMLKNESDIIWLDSVLKKMGGEND